MTGQGVLEFGILSFSSLFAMVNPISAAPIFVQLTQKTPEKRKRTAVTASLTALATLLIFATAGGAIFNFFGITVPAFRIVGGILFASEGMQVLMGKASKSSDEELEEGEDPSVVPIGIPLIAGAGAISTVMVLAGQAQTRPLQAGLGAAIIANIVLTYAVFAASPFIVNRMTRSAQNILAKIMGLLTAVIGVQFILNGSMAVLQDILLSIKK